MSSEFSDPFDFTAGELPLLISFPHEGCKIPPKVAESMTEAGRTSLDTDWFLKRLYDFEDSTQTARLSANYSRYIVDLNRDPSDDCLYPSQNTTGLFPRIRFDEEPIYQAEYNLTPREKARRIDEIWHPYHATLTRELQRLRSKFGIVVLFEAHSIASQVPFLFDGILPDLNFGTNAGMSCDPQLSNAVVQAASNHYSYSSVVNGRFIGGFITREYAEPELGIHAIQLEAVTSYLFERVVEGMECREGGFHPTRIAINHPSHHQMDSFSQLAMSTLPNERILFDGFHLLTMVPNKAPYGWLKNHKMIVEGGQITWIGEDPPVGENSPIRIINGDGKFLSPGLIDCHTHLVYGGNRADEWEQRLNGVSYEEIARNGGGILSTVRATRSAMEDELLASAKKRATRFLKQGVTTIEIKSGYGLDLESELKMLRVARRLEEELPVHVFTTLLAAHAVPPEFDGRTDDYVQLVCKEIIPAAAQENLCNAVDAFCESIAFDLEQTEQVFKAAIEHGLQIKVHAEQLSSSGAATLAAQMGAVSADHLEFLSDNDCHALAENDTVATLLPGAFYALKESQCPPVGSLRSLNVPIAIASDANPGSSPLSSILLAANMACTFFGLTPEEAMVGLTRNAAKALRAEKTLGTLEVGNNADFAIWDITSPAELAYGIGHNPCIGVYFAGRKVL